MTKEQNQKKVPMTDAEVESWMLGWFRREKSILCDRMRELAAVQGIKRPALKRARKALGVRTWHQFDEGGATVNWFWVLDDPEGSSEHE